MGVPRQVEEAADAAEEYLKGLDNTEADETTDTNDASGEVDTDDVNDDSADVDDNEPEDNSTDDADDSDEELYRNKYLTLKGKYDAEVPNLHTELKELKENIFGKIEELSKSQKEEKEEAVTEDKADAFREEFGDELVNYIEDYFNSKVKPQMEEAVKPVEEKIQSVEDSQIEVAKSEFADYLRENVKGDWENAANDPKFIEFLEQPDPSGVYTNGDLMAIYNENWDHERMAKVFNLYYGDAEAKPKGDKKPDPKPEKEAIVAPSRSTQNNVPKTDGKTIWTEETMNQFYKDDRAGKYPAEESVKMWDDLLSAASEGRIQ